MPRVIHFEISADNPAPKMAIPGMGYFSYCQDTEGNTFGIMQSDPSAK